jgi:ATP-dependent RNA helicase HelY
VLDAIGRLRPGDVIEIAGGKRRGRYAVMEVTQRRSERAPRVLLLSEDRSLIRFSPADFRDPPEAIAKLSLPRGFQTRDARSRRELGKNLAKLEKTGTRVRERAADFETPATPGPSRSSGALQEQIELHPCHACPEKKRHFHYAERAGRLERELAAIDRRMKRRTGTLAKRFDQVLGVLEELDYVKDWTLTGKGETLTRVYNESDLLVVECIERGLLEPLRPEELVAVCSSLVYETRGPETGLIHDMPTPEAAEVWRHLMKLWRQIRREEEARGLDLTREPDPGFARKAFRWSSGSPLEKVLGEEDAPGDFVRSIKQLVDLLRQLEDIAPDGDLGAKLRTAVESLNRGVIAYSSLEI